MMLNMTAISLLNPFTGNAGNVTLTKKNCSRVCELLVSMQKDLVLRFYCNALTPLFLCFFKSIWRRFEIICENDFS